MIKQARLLLVTALIIGLVAAPQVAHAAIRISKIYFDPPGEDSLLMSSRSADSLSALTSVIQQPRP